MPSRLTVVLVSLLLATLVSIFWIWLVILEARMATLCPEECKCDPGGYHVECIGQSLNSFPLIFPTNARELLLDDNNITSLEKDSFISRGLTELEKLTADSCQIRTIELGAFSGLTKLKRLSLQYNKIREIIPRTFENMNSLKYLNLRNNIIQQLEVNVFCGLVSLRDIILEENKLLHLQPDTFVGLPKLQSLYLSYNTVLQIPTDHHFINSRSLKHLRISHCNVSSVSVETFANVSALELLHLSFNNLRSVDINILRSLPKLSAMYLYYNPLQCDCQLQEVWRWCQDHNIQTAPKDMIPECDTPSEVQGKGWGVLEKGQCLEDSIHYYGDNKSTRHIYSPFEDTDRETKAETDKCTDTDTDRDNNTDSDKFPDKKYHAEVPFFIKQYQAAVYTVPFIFGTTGNFILLIIIICNKDMRTVPNMYILNLAISDIILLTVIFSEAWANRISDTWLQGDFMCTFLPFCRRLSVGLSEYSVSVLSFQRYRVTVNPFNVRVSSQSTWRATVATIFGVWIVATLFAIPSALSKYPCFMTAFLGRMTYCQSVVIFELIVSCVLPLCVIAFTYIMTARHLLKSADPMFEETQNPQLNTRKNTAKIVLGLTVVFLISYVPYHAFWTAYQKHQEDDFITLHEYYNLLYMHLVSTLFLLINPCLNPVAIFCTSRAFRRQFRRYLICCCKANSQATHLELTRRN